MVNTFTDLIDGKFPDESKIDNELRAEFKEKIATNSAIDTEFVDSD
ncbi:hypothetical protein ACVR1G_05015 [Streptococcus dentasini]